MSNETGFAAWLDSRMPTLKREWNRHMAEYYAPKNFNFWYYFGVLSMVVLVIQLITGIWLLMSYQGSSEQAFASIPIITTSSDSYIWGGTSRLVGAGTPAKTRPDKSNLEP